MQLVQNYKAKFQELKEDKQFANDRRKAARISKKVILGLFKAVANGKQDTPHWGNSFTALCHLA